MIVDYLDALSRALSFDPVLARGVRQEVEDHLLEAVAASPLPDRREAERRAVARFGHADALAAQFAVTSLARRVQWLGLAVVLAIAAVFATMKGRGAWFAAMDWTFGETARALVAPVILVDRCAFWLAVVLALGAVGYLWRHRIAAGRDPRRLRRANGLCAGATAALAVCVVADAVLTGLRVGGDLCVAALVPIGSMAIEIACAAVVAHLIRDAGRRAAYAAALLRT
jgi:hypothetical protein